MKTEIKQEGTQTIVTLEGRLDTTNAKDFETAIQPLLLGDNPNILLVCDNFSYISSSGLRLFLILQKSVITRHGSLAIKGLKPEIKEVFDMTGFSSIFTIL